MDIRDLESILAVFRHKSFSEAAYQTDFSLSAISKQVGRVEKEFGLKLFERKTKANLMTLTPEGESVLPAVERVVMEYENMLWQIENCKTDKQRSLSIGYVPLIGTIGERRILADYFVKYPKTEVIQVILFRKDLLHLLFSGKLDGIFIMLFGNYEGNREAWEALSNNELKTISTMKGDRLWVGISAKHPLAGHDSINLADLKDETFIFSSAQNPLYFPSMIHRVLELSGVPEAVFKTRFVDFIHKEVILDLVASGNGVLLQACMPPHRCEDIQFLPVQDWNVETTGLFVYRKSNTTRVLRDFIRCVESYTKQIQQEG